MKASCVLELSCFVVNLPVLFAFTRRQNSKTETVILVVNDGLLPKVNIDVPMK